MHQRPASGSRRTRVTISPSSSKSPIRRRSRRRRRRCVAWPTACRRHRPRHIVMVLGPVDAAVNRHQFLLRHGCRISRRETTWRPQWKGSNGPTPDWSFVVPAHCATSRSSPELLALVFLRTAPTRLAHITITNQDGQALPSGGVRVRRAPGHEAVDHRVRADRLSRGATRVDRGEVPRLVRSCRSARGRPRSGRHGDQRDAALAYRPPARPPGRTTRRCTGPTGGRSAATARCRRRCPSSARTSPCPCALLPRGTASSFTETSSTAAALSGTRAAQPFLSANFVRSFRTIR